MSFIYPGSEELIKKFFEEEEWEKARVILLRELEHEPHSVWLLTRIGTTYYEEKEYDKALKFTKKALILNPNDPLVLWDYATILDMSGNAKGAIELWEKIIGFGEDRVGTIETGEGLEWAKSLICDCYYRVGLAYLNSGDREKAFENLHLHLDLRKLGAESIYTLDAVNQKIKILNSPSDQSSMDA